MTLLNVRLAVKTPDGSGNDVIPHDFLSALMVNVAPEIHRKMGHGVVFIDRVEVGSSQAASAPPEAAAGRNSDEPDSGTPHKYALIALSVLLGVVCLVAIIVIVFYRRKTKR